MDERLVKGGVDSLETIQLFGASIHKHRHEDFVHVVSQGLAVIPFNHMGLKLLVYGLSLRNGDIGGRCGLACVFTSEEGDLSEWGRLRHCELMGMS